MMAWLAVVTLKAARWLLWMHFELARKVDGPDTCGGFQITVDESGVVSIPCFREANHPGDHGFGVPGDEGIVFWRVARLAYVANSIRQRSMTDVGKPDDEGGAVADGEGGEDQQA